MSFVSPPKPLSTAYNHWPARAKELGALVLRGAGLTGKMKEGPRGSEFYADGVPRVLFTISPIQKTRSGLHVGLLIVDLDSVDGKTIETKDHPLSVSKLAAAARLLYDDKIRYAAEEARAKKERFRTHLATARKERAVDRAKEKKGPVKFRLYDVAGRNIFVAYWGKNVRDAVEEFINGNPERFSLAGLTAPRVDLSGLGVMPDLHGARLDGSNLSDNEFFDLQRASARNAVFDRSFFGKDFDGRYGDFSGASFRGAELDRCDFSYADLSNADFRGASVSQVDFYGANLRGAVGLSELQRNGRRARSIR